MYTQNIYWIFINDVQNEGEIEDNMQLSLVELVMKTKRTNETQNMTIKAKILINELICVKEECKLNYHIESSINCSITLLLIQKLEFPIYQQSLI